MNKTPELVYIRTNPHTGTHFLLGLLTCADVNEFRYNGIESGAMFDYIRRVVQKEITLNDMIRQLSTNYGWPDSLKYFGFYEHLALPNTPAYSVADSWWLHHLTINGYPGYPVKTIMPLRNYRDVILTLLLQHSININEERRVADLNWLQTGYKFMAYHINHSNYFYVPLDLLGEQPVELRRAFVRGLFTNFLQIQIDENTFSDIITSWKPAHSFVTLLDVEKYYNENNEFRILLDIKNERQYVKGRHEEFDRQMLFYENQPQIQVMFNKYGYTV